MEWTRDAKARMGKAVLCEGNIVRKKREGVTVNRGKNIVEVDDIEIAKKKKVMKNISRPGLSIEGIESSNYWDLALCGSIKGCPFTLIDYEKVARILDKIIKEERLEDTMNEVLKRPILYHNKFKTAISSCPNSCSQPQIKDISIVGYKRPQVNEGYCVECQQCIKSCPDKLINVDRNPNINLKECIYCGKCIKACPTKSIEEYENGYKVYIGGRLGRRPYLARKVVDINNIQDLEKILYKLVIWYKECILNGENFSRTVENCNVNEIQQRIN